SANPFIALSAHREQAGGVALPDHTVADIGVKVSEPAAIEDWIADGPAAGGRLVIAEAEMHQTGVAIRQPAPESNRQLRAGGTVSDLDAERVVIEHLDRGAGRIANDPRRAELVGRDVESAAASIEG